MFKSFGLSILLVAIPVAEDAIASPKQPNLQQRQKEYAACLKRAERQYNLDLNSGKMTAEAAATARFKAIANCQYVANGGSASKR